MRIMLWSEYFPPYIGGVERNAMLLLPELKRRGHELLIVTSHHYMSLPDQEDWQGIPLYRFDFGAALAKRDLVTWVRNQKRLARLVEQFDPQLHHLFAIGPSMVPCLQILKQHNAPMVATLVIIEHSPNEAYAPEGVIAKALQSAAHITTISQAIADQTIKYLPEVRDRISVLHNSAPPTALEPEPLAEPPRILLLARLVHIKGGDLAVAAFEKLHQRYPSARLLIAGDGPERAALQEMASSMGEQVEFLGWVDPESAYAMLNRVSMVVIPSRLEGFPLVCLESGRMARPTIMSRLPGMDEMIVDGETGLLVEPEDVEGLAEAMAYLLDNPQQATAMGLAARERVDRLFTFERYVEEHEKLYTQILEIE